MSTAAPLIDRINSVRPWYRQVWPWLLMLGPFIVILAGIYTTWIAFAQQDAMVVDDYYKQGKAINQDLRRDRVASKLGLSFSGRYDVAAGKLQGTLLSFGAPVAGKVRIHLAHATQPEKDFKLEAQLDQHGQFSTALAMLERARWQVLIESEQRDWRLTGTWHWPQQHTVAFKADMPPAN